MLFGVLSKSYLTLQIQFLSAWPGAAQGTIVTIARLAVKIEKNRLVFMAASPDGEQPGLQNLAERRIANKSSMRPMLYPIVGVLPVYELAALREPTLHKFRAIELAEYFDN